MSAIEARRMGGIFLCMVVVVTAQCACSGKKREAQMLKYHNATVKLRSILEGRAVDYSGTKLGNSRAYLRKEEPNPSLWCLTGQERKRTKDAIRKLEERKIDKVPFLVLALLERSRLYDKAHDRLFPESQALGLFWLEGDDDTIGIVVKEYWPDGQVIVERYPLFQWMTPDDVWKEAWAGEPLKIISIIAEGTSERWILRIRSEEQRKDDHEWQRLLDLEPERRREMGPPGLWVSIPDGRKVSIAIYDSAGNSSQFVSVRAIGGPRGNDG